jgi:hypothetical protein
MMYIGGFMNTNQIIVAIDAEISKLKQARALLLTSADVRRGPGRPKSTEAKVPKPKRGRLSAKGRAAISAAMKARWAKKRK